MSEPTYPINGPKVDDPLALVKFIIRLYDDSGLLERFSNANEAGRRQMIDELSEGKITDPMHIHALVMADAARLHLALTHNLGLHVHRLDSHIMQHLTGP